MTTIIRIKRHREDDPVEAVVLACKRRKVGGEVQDLDSFKAILNFSGTVEKKDDRVAALISHQNRDSLKNHKPDITNKKRDENKQRTEENRFKVISCLRSMDVSELADQEEANKKNVTIVDVDVEKKSNESDEGMSSSEKNYVYDLYSTFFESEEDYNDLYIDNISSVHPLGYELQYRETGDHYNDEYDDPDEDDSNDEGNWRNDYPDSDHSIDEDDMRLANQLKGFGIDDGYDLSSDDDDEKYPNYDDKDDYLHYKNAEDLGGSKYAKYKRSVLKELTLSDDEDSY